MTITAPAGEDRWEERLIATLRPFVPTPTHRGNPGALAELRRYTQGQLPSAGTLSPILAELPGWADESHMADVLLVAGLFARHPEHSAQHRSFGTSLGAYRNAKHPGADSAPIDTRLRVLLATPRSGLDHHLRQAITLLSGGSVPVNYAQLLRDVMAWDNVRLRPDGLTYAEAVRLRWLRDYAHTAPSAAMTKPVIFPESEDAS